MLHQAPNSTHRSAEKNERKVKARKVSRSGKTNTDCRCPMCGAVHKVFMRWSGRGTPRIYCTGCRSGVGMVCDWTADMGVVLLGGKSPKGSHAALE